MKRAKMEFERSERREGGRLEGTAEVSPVRELVTEGARRLRRPLLAAASGVLMALAFPYPSLWPLAFVAVVPLLAAVDGAGAPAAMLLGWLAGAVFFAILCDWVSVFGVSALFLLALYAGFFLALFALGARSMLKRLTPWQSLAGIPALWVAIEYLRSFGPYSFPWGILGESVKSAALMQAASLIGGFGLSYLVLLVTVLVYQSIKGGVPTNSKRIALLAAVVIAWYGWGVYALGRPVPPATTRVALLQGNVPQEVKLRGSAGYYDMKRLYLDLTTEAAKTWPDLIIWPETAVPNELLLDPDYVADVRAAGSEGGAKVIAGAFYRDETGIHNSAFLLEDGVPPAYLKIHPVPFGEYTPFRSIATRVNALAGVGEDQVPGSELAPLSFDGKRLATVICFESAYSRLMAAMTRAGARVGVVITNDGWFGRSSAAGQHFELARFRAIESGVYVAQAANTGISGIIDPKGRVVARTGLEERKIVYGRIGYATGPSVYARMADFLPVGYFAVAAAMLAVALLRGRKEDRGNKRM